MNTTYKVHVYAIERRKNIKKIVTSYRVHWDVAKNRFSESFTTFALADSFRADLISAMRSGEAFDRQSGLPVSAMRDTKSVSWLNCACSFISMKWSESSPKYRRSLAESLTCITLAMIIDDKALPPAKELRKTLMAAFNLNTMPSESAAKDLEIINRASREVKELSDPEILRSVLAAISSKLNGTKAAPNTIRIRRAALSNVINYAKEKNLLSTNPLVEIKTKKYRNDIRLVEPSCVPNPAQARELLNAVKTSSGQGPRLFAFFGLMYFAALRPEEASNLKKTNLILPEPQWNETTQSLEFSWGTLRLDKASPEVGRKWTDSGQISEERALKHREDGELRSVPCPPELAKMLHDHIKEFGVAPDGRLFRGIRDGGRIGSSTYGRIWATAREKALPPKLYTSSLAQRPYDLRHAAVSTWLHSGVDPTRVAQWAGHSVSVLLKVYAKSLDGGEQTARTRVEKALNNW